jgi:hypothetical protein
MSGGNGTKILACPRKGRIVAGICAGIACYSGLSDHPGLAPFRSCHDPFGGGSLVILPAHDPVAVSRLAQATGQVPTLTTE